MNSNGAAIALAARCRRATGAQLAARRLLDDPTAAFKGEFMRSIEFFTYLLPSDQAGGPPRPSRFKITRWQAVAWPGATCVEDTRELRMCPESPAERQLLGIPGIDDSERSASPNG